MYSVISVTVDSLPGNTKNWESTRSWPIRVQFVYTWAVLQVQWLILKFSGLFYYLSQKLSEFEKSQRCEVAVAWVKGTWRRGVSVYTTKNSSRYRDCQVQKCRLKRIISTVDQEWKIHRCRKRTKEDLLLQQLGMQCSKPRPLGSGLGFEHCMPSPPPDFTAEFAADPIPRYATKFSSHEYFLMISYC